MSVYFTVSSLLSLRIFVNLLIVNNLVKLARNLQLKCGQCIEDRENTVNSFITFVLLAVGLGMASVKLSLPLLTETGQYAAQGAANGMNGFMILCLSVAGLGFALAFKSK